MEKNRAIVLIAVLALCTSSLGAEGKTLFVYDEENDSSKPYIEYFKAAFDSSGIAYDTACAAELPSRDLSPYGSILIHGMVMAFNASSPVRDWLKKKPDLSGKRVLLLVTANRWFVKDLTRDLTGLLTKNKAEIVDAVSMATKKLDAIQKAAAVESTVARLR